MLTSSSSNANTVTANSYGSYEFDFDANHPDVCWSRRASAPAIVPMLCYADVLNTAQKQVNNDGNMTESDSSDDDAETMDSDEVMPVVPATAAVEPMSNAFVLVPDVAMEPPALAFEPLMSDMSDALVVIPSAGIPVPAFGSRAGFKPHAHKSGKFATKTTKTTVQITMTTTSTMTMTVKKTERVNGKPRF